MPYLTKQYKFCAAHRYWNPNWSESKNYQVFGEDVRIHGHNYNLDVTIHGPINDDSGFIVNIFELNKIESIDIDEPEDFNLAKRIYSYENINNW